MKSGKQRKSELKARRLARAERDAARMPDRVAVNPEKLSPFNSYDSPDFLKRGYYLDKGFTCQGCGAREIWTGYQQKWWYEVAKGYVFSEAKLCRACRRRERDRRAEARRVHLEGLESKQRRLASR